MDDGIILADAALPALQSLPPYAGPSTTNYVAVIECTVVIKPSAIPKFSCNTLASGAKQFVVHEALDIIFSSALYRWWLTPTTYVGVFPFDGALMITFYAPPFKCNPAFSSVKNAPVDSQTIEAPGSPHLILLGSFSAKTLILCPSTIIP